MKKSYFDKNETHAKIVKLFKIELKSEVKWQDVKEYMKMIY